MPETIQLAEFHFKAHYFFFPFKITQILKAWDWFQPVVVKSSRGVITWV